VFGNARARNWEWVGLLAGGEVEGDREFSEAITFEMKIKKISNKKKRKYKTFLLAKNIPSTALGSTPESEMKTKIQKTKNKKQTTDNKNNKNSVAYKRNIHSEVSEL
jgi:predicted phage-related endonuclease